MWRVCVWDSGLLRVSCRDILYLPILRWLFLLLVVSPAQTQDALLFSILCYLLLTFFPPPSQLLCDIMVFHSAVVWVLFYETDRYFFCCCCFGLLSKNWGHLEVMTQSIGFSIVWSTISLFQVRCYAFWPTESQRNFISHEAITGEFMINFDVKEIPANVNLPVVLLCPLLVSETSCSFHTF